MDWTILIWVFFLIAAIQPVIRQRLVEAARLRLMRQLEEKRGSRLIALIHRQETMSFLGFPLTRYIDINDSEQVLRAIKLTDPQVPIDMVLHTPGGLVLATEQIANALSKRAGKVTVFVPHYAMSGGTLIAISADEIVMDENAVLGPVDPQLGQYPAASIIKVVEQKNIDKVDDETLILTDVARKALTQVNAAIQRILLANHMPQPDAERISDTLSCGQWTHDYPITVDEARSIGLNVTTDMPTEVYQLMNLYPQAPQRRPTVAYIPLPYPTRPSTSPGEKR